MVLKYVNHSTVMPIAIWILDWLLALANITNTVQALSVVCNLCIHIVRAHM